MLSCVTLLFADFALTLFSHTHDGKWTGATRHSTGSVCVPLAAVQERVSSVPTRIVRLNSLTAVPLLSFPNPIPALPATNSLQILAALHILGRGSCLDDISQLSLMSKQMAAVTFHKFCRNFAEDLYEEHIYLPTGAYQDKVMDEYHKLGFTGAIGSTDVTHVGWGMCPFTLGRSFTGKEGFPTIAFQVTVDHAGRALAVTKGFTGATNDKTIIRYDAAVAKIGTDPQYKDREYKLRKADGTFRTRRGCYLIVDNGYHEVNSRDGKLPSRGNDRGIVRIFYFRRRSV